MIDVTDRAVIWWKICFWNSSHVRWTKTWDNGWSRSEQETRIWYMVVILRMKWWNEIVRTWYGNNLVFFYLFMQWIWHDELGMEYSLIGRSNDTVKIARDWIGNGNVSVRCRQWPDRLRWTIQSKLIVTIILYP